VVFYIDPKIVQDFDGKDVNTITLSYTFHPQRDSRRPVADNASAGRPGGRI
jgi:cytochrome c oxidase assembly protein subunit 11